MSNAEVPEAAARADAESLPLVRTRSIRRFGAQVLKPEVAADWEPRCGFYSGVHSVDTTGEELEGVPELVEAVHGAETLDNPLEGVAAAAGIRGLVEPYQSKGFLVGEEKWKGLHEEEQGSARLCILFSLSLVLLTIFVPLLTELFAVGF
jgi:hypothetical protein